MMKRNQFCVAWPKLLTRTLVVAVFGAGQVASGQSIPFDRFPWGELIMSAPGEYVIRDSTTWEAEIVPGWPVMYREVDGQAEIVPAPTPDFSDSLFMYVSYGTSGCYETGGDVESITRDGSIATVQLGHVFRYWIVCAAEIPRGYFVRVAKSAIPDDVEIEFQRPTTGYEIDPQRWYPLAVGNAWSFSNSTAGTGTSGVEKIDAVIEHEGQQWFHVGKHDCADADCQPVSEYLLRWSEDDYLVRAEAGFVDVDTLHRSAGRSVFSLDEAADTFSVGSPTGGATEYVEGRIFLSRDGPVDNRLVLSISPIPNPMSTTLASYRLGYGPIDAFGAVIGGMHMGETSAISIVLDTERAPEPPPGISLEIFPNPVMAEATIVVRAQAAGMASVSLFDALGRRIARKESLLAPGDRWIIHWNELAATASGLYLVRATGARGSTIVRPVVVVR